MSLCHPLEKILKSAEETEGFGAELAKTLKQGDVLCLYGTLGAGKTTLTRGIVTGLGGDKADVSSPTFALLNEYDCKNITVQHCDLYRLNQGNELEDFGGLEFFDDVKITIVEWPERSPLISLISSKRLVSVHLEIIGDHRKITVTTQK